MISRQDWAWCQLQSSEILHHVTYIYQIFQKNFISRKGRWPIFNMIGFICDIWHTFDHSPHTIGHSWSINPSIQQTVSHWPFFWAAVYLMHSGNYGQCAWLHATDKSINSFTTQYKYICLVCQMCLPGLQMYLWHLSTPSVQRAWLRAASQLIHPFNNPINFDQRRADQILNTWISPWLQNLYFFIEIGSTFSWSHGGGNKEWPKRVISSTAYQNVGQCSGMEWSLTYVALQWC